MAIKGVQCSNFIATTHRVFVKYDGNTIESRRRSSRRNAIPNPRSFPWYEKQSYIKKVPWSNWSVGWAQFWVDGEACTNARARNATRRGLSGARKPRVEILESRLTTSYSSSASDGLRWPGSSSRDSRMFRDLLLVIVMEHTTLSLLLGTCYGRRHRVTRLNEVDVRLRNTRVGLASRPSICHDPIDGSLQLRPWAVVISFDWSFVLRSIKISAMSRFLCRGTLVYR